MVIKLTAEVTHPRTGFRYLFSSHSKHRESLPGEKWLAAWEVSHRSPDVLLSSYSSESRVWVWEHSSDRKEPELQCGLTEAYIVVGAQRSYLVGVCQQGYYHFGDVSFLQCRCKGLKYTIMGGAVYKEWSLLASKLRTTSLLQASSKNNPFTFHPPFLHNFRLYTKNMPD